ncbi:unnamed protein product [Effrenium voratum]|nr:unnamed protein product [Effrenium voratum]
MPRRVLFPHLLCPEESPPEKGRGPATPQKLTGKRRLEPKEAPLGKPLAIAGRRKEAEGAEAPGPEADEAKEAMQPPESRHTPKPEPPLASDEVVFSWSGLLVTSRDLQCLEDGEMLNDAVVDFFLQLMQSFLPSRDLLVFSSHFFTRLTAAQAANGEVGWENVKGWTKKKSLFAQKLLVVPINCELHWWLALLHLDASACCLSWLDSLPGKESRYLHVQRFLSGYLRRESRERGTPPLEGPVASRHLPAQLQDNGVDCGVFLLDNVWRLLCAGGSVDDVEWCSQAAAASRRAKLRRISYRLAQLRGDAAVLVEQPELLAKLQQIWGRP